MNVAENVHDHRVIVAELELGNRHKGQSLGNKPDRHGTIKYALFEPPLERRIVVAGTMLVRETILGPANQGNGSAFGALRDEYDLRGCRPRRSAL